MISYAQNREDVLLSRAFGDQPTGFYVDVGAHHPLIDSITKHFYDRGWRGINVEPGATFSAFPAERQADTNLQCALSHQAGTATLYEFPGTGLSTLCSAEAEARKTEGRKPAERQVETITLATLCQTYVTREIDFISIDVEGHEHDVIAGGDWQRWRPRIAVVESTRPNSRVTSHQSWEHILLSADYTFGCFDGLNRFYVRNEDLSLLAALRHPVSALDQVVPFAHLNQVQELQGQVAALEATIAELRQSQPLRYWLSRAAAKARRWVSGQATTRRRENAMQSTICSS